MNVVSTNKQNTAVLNRHIDLLLMSTSYRNAVADQQSQE